MATIRKERGYDRSLLLLSPLSTIELFSKELCGLPSDTYGCTNCRERGTGPTSCGIPANKVLVHPEYFWLIFAKNPSQSTQLHVLKGQDVQGIEKLFKGQHFAAFAFKKLPQQPAEASPLVAVFRGWSDKTLEHQPISDWYQGHKLSDSPDLNQCFGREVFSSFPIKDGDTHFVMAALIRNYLNHNCSTFLQHEKGKRFGIQLCRINRNPPGGALHNCAISFSAIHPQTNEIQFWDEPNFGSRAKKSLNSQKKASLDFRPVTCSNDPGNRVTFADCFTEDFRNQILSRELNQTFLSFSMGEIAAYFLHWIMLRIFADPEGNQSFIKAFSLWKNSGVDLDTSERMGLFDKLLKAKVRLMRDANLFRAGGDSPVVMPEWYVFETPVSFATVLMGLDLDYAISGDHKVLKSTVEFLVTEFPENQSENASLFSELPMYRNLGWSAPRSLISLYKKANYLSRQGRKKYVAGVLDSVTAQSIWYRNKQPVNFEKELKAHHQRAVFPFKHILCHWPRNASEIAHYLIIPLWEAPIQDNIRPVIFAHVFREESPPTDPQELFEYTTELQHQLMPSATLLTMHYEPARHEHQISQGKMDAGGFMAHELNKLLRKDFSSLRNQFIKSEDPNGKRWALAWDKVSSTAHLAYLSAKASLSQDHNQELRLRFLKPLQELQATNTLVQKAWQVASVIYIGSKRPDDHYGKCGPPKIDALEDLQRQAGFDPFLTAIPDDAYASLFLLLGELIRNFRTHSPSAQKGKRGQLHISLEKNKLLISLEDWREGIPDGQTIHSLARFLRSFNLGDLKPEWIEKWVRYRFHAWISLAQ